jgi:alpha,alpha-trehalase
LTAAQEDGRTVATISYDRLHENPVGRLERVIRDVFWPGLTRRLDADVIGLATKDPKNWTDDHTRLYVPAGADAQFRYYSDIAASNPDLRLKVETLPEKITIGQYRELCDNPGLLALDTEDYVDENGETKTRAVPFMVPGGCYNEFYGWDSHFIGLGLLAQEGMTDLVRGIVKNFIFEIQHYGLIPNANRSYYLLRSQPPFLTDLSLRLYHATKDSTPDAKEFLKRGLQAAIKEYHSVWMAHPRLDQDTGLSLFAPDGAGVPPECSEGHFAKFLVPYAEKHGMTLQDFTAKYNRGGITDEPDLDEYFMHDRGVRESGHDTSTRLEHKCAYIATVDLNCLLYKYETDVARAIADVFDHDFPILPEFQVATSDADCLVETWTARAEERKEAMNKYLWNDAEGIFSDYHVKLRRQIEEESPTTYWSLWCGLATPEQASRQVAALPKFERLGGLAASSEAALDRDAVRPHQWDYPFGWAPHQMMAWEGLRRYGFGGEATRLAYKWLWVVMKGFVDYNGAILEKYEMTNDKDPHRCRGLEHNEGTDFHGFAREG